MKEYRLMTSNGITSFTLDDLQDIKDDTMHGITIGHSIKLNNTWLVVRESLSITAQLKQEFTDYKANKVITVEGC